MRVQTNNSNNLVSVIITLLIAIFLFYFLNQFAKTTKAGIDGNNPQQISQGLGSLSSYFKIIGVLLIICIVIFGLVILVLGIGSKV